jgi:hypothetical protein
MAFTNIGTIGNQNYSGSELILSQGDFVESPIPWDTCANNSVAGYGLYHNIISVSNVQLLSVGTHYTFYFYGCIPPQMDANLSSTFTAQYSLGYTVSGTTSTRDLNFQLGRSEDQGTNWSSVGGTMCTFTRGTFSAGYIGTNLWDNVYYDNPSNEVHPILIYAQIRNLSGTNNITIDKLNVFYKLILTPK